MDKILGFIILVAIVAAIIGFIGFMFSIHWSLGILALLFILGRTL